VSLPENLRSLNERIARACESVGRDPAEVTLVAVTKTHSPEVIREAYDLGLRDFGENRLQEAQPKIDALPEDIVWHFIGHLQSNKVRKIAALFSVVHSFDSVSQLQELEKTTGLVDGLIAVNLSKEPQKSGVSPPDLDVYATRLINSTSVRFQGLMTVGPALADPQGMRPYFQALREANRRLGGKWLSMGMSGDFEVAVQEGATHIRIGSALFGSRG
jgi:pyridoxal phosphate enzyme (YggS family)